MKSPLETFLDSLARFNQLDPAERAERLRQTEWIGSATDHQVDQLLDALLKRQPPGAEDTTQSLLVAALGQLGRRFRVGCGSSGASGLASATRERIVALEVASAKLPT